MAVKTTPAAVFVSAFLLLQVTFCRGEENINDDCRTFSCDNSTNCLNSLSRVCDGQPDCEDLEDESVGKCREWQCPFQTVKERVEKEQ